ncbi:hypothetical protein BLA29_005902 [Euroglyphus maynei]|uniref:Uncharacterized protein n=1 Tax=Euroglyphus maynei TaxID=6958 RepID=A0A1Y3ASV2_EURMA|nr:hypothetical protein BLA29_005902 [Euroglyphus maynei]
MKSVIRREKSIQQPPPFKVIEVINLRRPSKSKSLEKKPSEPPITVPEIEREITTQSLRKTTSKAFGMPYNDGSCWWWWWWWTDGYNETATTITRNNHRNGIFCN